MGLIKPIGEMKQLSMSLNLGADLPVMVFGDQKRLMQIILNLGGNAIKFTSEGSVSVTATVVEAKLVRERCGSDFFPLSVDGFFFLQVQVSYRSVDFC